MDAAADMVWFLHAAFVVLNVLTPFVGNVRLLRYHVIIIPFLYLHWVTNNDACALTLIERTLRKVDTKDSFFHRLVSPVYRFHECGIDRFVWIASFVLWTISMVRYFR